MVDVIPGAVYYDTVLERTAKCIGTSPRDGEVDVVHLNYEGIEDPVEAPFHLMREADTFEVEELPY
jgi:hypothetical protein